MNIYKVIRTYHRDKRTTWHDSKMSADRIVKRHKRLGKKFMRKLDKLESKYPFEKRQYHLYIAETYEKEVYALTTHFAEEHGEKDSPMKWVEMEKINVKPLRSSLVAFVRQVDNEWDQGDQPINRKETK
jgi:hypothetical protein